MLATLLKRIELNIRQGKGAQARHQLQEIVRKPMDRRWKARVANLLWRANLPGLGATLLSPLVRNDRKGQNPAAMEKAEYAVCLLKLGAQEEARALVLAIDVTECPLALLYQAFVPVASWDYAASIPQLNAFLETPQIDPYQKLVARINLGAAYIHEQQLGSAETLLRELALDPRINENTLALGRMHELWAELYVAKKEWGEARRKLDEAEIALKESEGIDLLFVKKYRAVVSLLENPGSAKALGELLSVRAEAVARRHAETIRDCDFFQAKALNDFALMQKVYFGTPYESYRRRVRQLVPMWTPGSAFTLSFGDGKGPMLDLTTDSRGCGDLKPGSVLFRLFTRLLSDSYKPQRLASFFSHLYPGERFHPAHSPNRVRQVILRFRRWLQTNELPIEVCERNGEYWLSGDFKVVVSAALDAPSREAQILAKLKSGLPQANFSVTDAGKLLEMSPRTVRRTLANGLTNRKLSRSGRGKATRYAFR